MTKNISRSTEEKGHPTEALFSSPTMVALLEIFFLHPEEEFYQRQLGDLAGKLVQSSGLKRESSSGGQWCSEKRYWPGSGKTTRTFTRNDPRDGDFRSFIALKVGLSCG